MGRHCGGGISGGNAYERAFGLPAGSIASTSKVYRAWKKKTDMNKKVASKPKPATKRTPPNLAVHEKIKYNAAFKPPSMLSYVTQALLPGAAPALAPPPPNRVAVVADRVADRGDVIDLTESPKPKPTATAQQRGGRAAAYRSRIQACGCKYDDGERVGAKVATSKSATNFGRLYYTCGFAKVNGSRAGLGGFRCVTSEKRWIAWVRDADVAKERDRVVY